MNETTDSRIDQVVIITGATGNLGAACAEYFLEAGSRVVLVDRKQDRLNRHYSALVGHEDHLLAGDIDIADSSAMAKLFEKVRDRFGRMDVLINTVGGYRGGKPVHEQDLADWDLLFNTNLRTTLICCREIVPHMRNQRSGRIINISSRAALAGTANYAAYSASKAAVLRLSESLAEELKDYGINVNCVLPGIIDTAQNRTAMPNADFTRWVAASDIANVIGFLASDASRSVNGAAIPVYGKG